MRSLGGEVMPQRCLLALCEEGIVLGSPGLVARPFVGLHRSELHWWGWQVLMRLGRGEGRPRCRVISWKCRPIAQNAAGLVPSLPLNSPVGAGRTAPISKGWRVWPHGCIHAAAAQLVSFSDAHSSHREAPVKIHPAPGLRGFSAALHSEC